MNADRQSLIEFGKYSPGLFGLGLTIEWTRRAKSVALDVGPVWIRLRSRR